MFANNFPIFFSVHLNVCLAVRCSINELQSGGTQLSPLQLLSGVQNLLLMFFLYFFLFWPGY